MDMIYTVRFCKNSAVAVKNVNSGMNVDSLLRSEQIRYFFHFPIPKLTPKELNI